MQARASTTGARVCVLAIERGRFSRNPRMSSSSPYLFYVPRQQHLEVLDVLRMGEALEDYRKIRVRLDSIRLGALDERVEVCAGAGTFDGVTE
jgi:hypothetical protein